MKVFITGATGFLGRHLVDELLARGCEVTALARTFDRARSLPATVRTVAGDVTRRASLRTGMRGADLVVHLATAKTIGRRAREAERLARINVAGTREVLELAGELGVPRLVYTGTLAAFGPAPGRVIDEGEAPKGSPLDESVYERTKRTALVEVVRPLQRQGLPVMVVCPGQLFGPGDNSPVGRALQLYARRRLPVMFGGDSTYNWTDVREAAVGHWLAAERGQPGETYFLAGPALTMRAFFERAEQATGLPVPRVWLPSRLVLGLAQALRSTRPPLAAALQLFAGAPALATAGKAQVELGWQPRPVETSLAETVAWLQAEAQRQEEPPVAAPVE